MLSFKGIVKIIFSDLQNFTWNRRGLHWGEGKWKPQLFSFSKDLVLIVRKLFP